MHHSQLLSTIILTCVFSGGFFRSKIINLGHFPGCLNFLTGAVGGGPHRKSPEGVGGSRRRGNERGENNWVMRKNELPPRKKRHVLLGTGQQHDKTLYIGAQLSL